MIKISYSVINVCFWKIFKLYYLRRIIWRKYDFYKIWWKYTTSVFSIFEKNCNTWYLLYMTKLLNFFSFFMFLKKNLIYFFRKNEKNLISVQALWYHFTVTKCVLVSLFFAPFLSLKNSKKWHFLEILILAHLYTVKKFCNNTGIKIRICEN